MREALTSYIEATYHLSHPKVVSLRRALLMEGGVAQTPFIESTPAYVGDRKFASLALDERICDFLTSLASKESGELLFNPPYEHQAQALEATIHANAGGTGIVVTTGTGSGKTESFLLPVLARLAEEAIQRPKHFSERAVRALLLYPMNALVNDQLGRLRTLFGSSAVRGWFTRPGRASGQVRPIYWPDALSGHSRWRARSKAAENPRILSEDRGWRALRQRKGQGARSNSPEEGALAGQARELPWSLRRSAPVVWQVWPALGGFERRSAACN